MLVLVLVLVFGSWKRKSPPDEMELRAILLFFFVPLGFFSLGSCRGKERERSGWWDVQ